MRPATIAAGERLPCSLCLATAPSVYLMIVLRGGPDAVSDRVALVSVGVQLVLSCCSFGFLLVYLPPAFSLEVSAKVFSPLALVDQSRLALGLPMCDTLTEFLCHLALCEISFSFSCFSVLQWT